MLRRFSARTVLQPFSRGFSNRSIRSSVVSSLHEVPEGETRRRLLAQNGLLGLGSAAVAAGLLGSRVLCEDDNATLLPPEKLNQRGRQSMSAWSVVREGKDHYVESVENRNERFKAPDGSNFVDEVPHPPFIKQRNWSVLREAMEKGSKSSDIWVATYPKCGTTFMEQIILLLLLKGDASQLTPEIQNSYDKKSGIGKVWVEASVRVVTNEPPMGKRDEFSFEEFSALPEPRLLKTHAPRQMFLGVCPTCPPSLADSGRPAPLAPGVKVVYVSRNAKDACVSSYYHAANPQKLGFPFDAWVVNWMAGLFEHGRWSDHVAGWRNELLNNPEQVLWVRYEDLKADPEGEIRRVAAFLTIPASDDTIAKTVHGSGFKQMQVQSKRLGSAGSNHGNQDFFRKGVVGDYRKHFSSQLNQEFDDLYKEQMRGVSDPYADF